MKTFKELFEVMSVQTRKKMGRRMAKLAKEGGDTAQFASMMSGIGGAASTYKSLGGNFTEFGGGQETGGGTYQAMEAGGRMKGQSGR